MNDGLLPGDEFNPYDFEGVASSSSKMLENEGKRTHNDKTHAAITKLVITDILQISSKRPRTDAAEGAVEICRTFFKVFVSFM